MIVPIVGNTDGEHWFGRVYYGRLSQPSNMVHAFVGHWGDWTESRRGRSWSEDFTTPRKQSGRYTRGISIYKAQWEIGVHK